MTDLDNDTSELNIDELDEVSGGWIWVRQPGHSIYSFAQFAWSVGNDMGRGAVVG